MPNTHLMIVEPRDASLILTGQKLVEARLGRDRLPQAGGVLPGDAVFIMPRAQRTIAKAIVERVDEYRGMETDDIERLHAIYNDRVLGDEAFWTSQRDARYAMFITLGRVRMIHDDSIVPEALRAPGRDTWRMLSDRSELLRRAA